MSLWNAVCSVLLCTSVRNRTHPLDEIITTKVAGEFLLSQRVFLSLTELTDLTEPLCAQFRAHRRPPAYRYHRTFQLKMAVTFCVIGWLNVSVECCVFCSSVLFCERKYAPSVRKRMFESRMGRLTLTGHTAFHVLTPWEHVMIFRLSRRLSSNWFTCQLVNLSTCLFYLKIIQRLFCVIHKRIKSKSSTLVRILKRRGGNCRCKDIPFILVLQAF